MYLNVQQEATVPLTDEQKKYIAAITDVVLEVIRESKSVFGVPGGHIYAALMGHGWSLAQYESLMDVLVQCGKVVKRGDCYFPTEKVN